MSDHSDFYWHVVTKAQAVVAYLRGQRGVAIILWRWMRNRPDAEDMRLAREALARPSVQLELQRLVARPAGGEAPEVQDG